MGATAANLNDGPLWAPLLHNAPIIRPQATQSSPHHLGLDAAFANAPARQVILQERYPGHIAPKGGRSDDHPPPPGGQARRGKGERTQAWHAQFRRLVMNWEKTLSSHYAFLCLANALIAYRT